LVHGDEKTAKALHSNFCSKIVTDEQKTIVCQPWYRIYTTNYDDVVERICTEEKKLYTTKEITDPVNRPMPDTTQLIHIYGNITRSSETEFAIHKVAVDAPLPSRPIMIGKPQTPSIPSASPASFTWPCTRRLSAVSAAMINCSVALAVASRPAANDESRRGNGGCRLIGSLPISALTVGELSATAVSRPKFACDGRPEHFAQLCRTPWTESGFKSRLSL
jgi:hypothetical protein